MGEGLPSIIAALGRPPDEELERHSGSDGIDREALSYVLSDEGKPLAHPHAPSGIEPDAATGISESMSSYSHGPPWPANLATRS